jgi:hypothetical protein
MTEAKEPAEKDAKPEETAEPTFREAFAAALQKSGFGQVEPGQAPTPGALLRAVGGVRGIIESILPILAFVVIYTITKNVFWSVAIPVAIGVVFLVIRIVTRTPWMAAAGGLFLAVVSAIITIATGQGENNFLLGFWINGVCLAVILLSLLLRRPLVGVIAGYLTGDTYGWLKDKAKFRVALIATLLWLLVFAIRLGVELPLYFAGEAAVLGVMKIVLGVPLYATALWITWLIVRTAYARPVEH